MTEAHEASPNAKVYYDLGEGKNASKIRKQLQWVAEHENIPITIRCVRKENRLSFFLAEGNQSSSGQKGRMSGDEARERILATLKDAGKPLSKSEIDSVMGVSPSTWNLRVRELLNSGAVWNEGERRDSKYDLA